MLLDIWFTNTRTEEQLPTFQFLQNMGAEGVSVKLGESGYEYTCRMYADTDEDIQKVVKVMLYYGDRNPEDLEKMHFLFPRKRTT